MRPSLESLRTLAECVRLGSFAAAAESLFLTPAAVSLRIRTLERELGKLLFVRRGPRTTPTDAALALAARIDRAMAEIDEALGEFQGARPLVRMTAPPSFAARWLAPRVARYQSEHPGVAIELDVSTDMRTRDMFDVAVRTGAGVWPGLEARALFPVDLTPMLSPALLGDDRLAEPADLLRFALLPHPHWPRWLRETGCADDRQARYGPIEYPSHELNADAALAGEGVALLPRSLFRPLLDTRGLVAPFDHVLAETDWHFAVLHAGETRPEPAEVVAWLTSQVALDRSA